MTLYREIRTISPDLSTTDLLRFLLTDKFPGKTLVTASLKAPSTAVLKMIADIDPETPVVFCRRGVLFPESETYFERIVSLLGLKNASHSSGGEVEVVPGDHDHFERMWAESQVGSGRSYEIAHLNQTLAPYDCWISAVYHVDRAPEVSQRVDVEGRIIRVDPLVRWSRDDVRAFMRENKLPFHPRAVRPTPPPVEPDQPSAPSYSY